MANEVITIDSETSGDIPNEIEDLSFDSKKALALVPTKEIVSAISISSDSGYAEDEPSRLRSDEVAESSERKPERSSDVTPMTVEEIKEQFPDDKERKAFIKGRMQELFHKIYGQAPESEKSVDLYDEEEKEEEADKLTCMYESLNERLSGFLKECDRLMEQETSGEGVIVEHSAKNDAGESEATTGLGDEKDLGMTPEPEFQAHQKSTVRSDCEPDGKAEVNRKSVVPCHGKGGNG